MHWPHLVGSTPFEIVSRIKLPYSGFLTLAGSSSWELRISGKNNRSRITRFQHMRRSEVLVSHSHHRPDLSFRHRSYSLLSKADRFREILVEVIVVHQRTAEGILHVRGIVPPVTQIYLAFFGSLTGRARVSSGRRRFRYCPEYCGYSPQSDYDPTIWCRMQSSTKSLRS